MPETVTGAVEPWDEGGSIVPDVDWGSCGGISVLWGVGVRMVSAAVWSEYYILVILQPGLFRPGREAARGLVEWMCRWVLHRNVQAKRKRFFLVGVETV